MSDVATIPLDRVQQPARAASAPLVEVNPYHAWLKTLAIGASFGAVGMMIDTTWQCLMLAARLQGFLPQNKLRAWYPLFALAIAAMQWVAAWLLTTEEPTIDAPRQSITSRLLRWSITALFVLMSAYVLRLFEELPRDFVSNRLWPSMQFAVIVTTLLVFIQVRRLALRIDSPGLAWRSYVALVGLVFADALQLVPFVFPSLSYGSRQITARHFRNFQGAMIALWSTIGALVYIRLMVATIGEWGRDRKRREDVSTALVSTESTTRSGREAPRRWLSFLMARRNGGNAPSDNATSGG